MVRRRDFGLYGGGGVEEEAEEDEEEEEDGAREEVVVENARAVASAKPCIRSG